MWVEGRASVIPRNAPPSLLIDGPEGPTVGTYGLPVRRPAKFLKLAPSRLLGVSLWDIRRREDAFVHQRTANGASTERPISVGLLA